MTVLRPVETPRFGPTSSDVDVAIVGAGAAGIAAARCCVSEKLTCVVLEARPHIGGRCVTADVAGHPVDLGAHWLHAGNLNPLVKLGIERGEPLSRSQSAGEVIVDGRAAPSDIQREQREAFEKAGAAIAAAAGRERDPSIAEIMPALGRWGPSVEDSFAIISGRPLDEVSAQDFPAEEFADNWFVQGGYGAYLARLAEGLPIAVGQSVERIDWTGHRIALEGRGGTVTARAVIVTVPVAVLAAGTIRFTPELPDPWRNAIDGFLPGTYEHILLNWPDSPFAHADRLVKIIGASSSYGIMSRVGGSPIHYLEIDYRTAEAHGRNGPALAAFAREWLASELGSEAVRNVSVPHVTDWVGDPLSRCGWAVARPGRAGDRETLAEPVAERLWLVGEATSRHLWGTVGGAWLEAEKAVRSIAGTFGAIRPSRPRQSASLGPI